MILNINSTAAYLGILNAQSRIVGYFQLTSNSNIKPYIILNSAMLVKYKALYYVVLLVIEVEIASVFFNTQMAILI